MIVVVVVVAVVVVVVVVLTIRHFMFQDIWKGSNFICKGSGGGGGVCVSVGMLW